MQSGVFWILPETVIFFALLVLRTHLVPNDVLWCQSCRKQVGTIGWKIYLAILCPFLTPGKSEVKVCIPTIGSSWGFLNKKIKYIPRTGKSYCHLPNACFPFGLLNSSFLLMVVVVKAETLEHFGVFWNLISCQNTECLHGNVLMEFARKSINLLQAL